MLRNSIIERKFMPLDQVIPNHGIRISNNLLVRILLRIELKLRISRISVMSSNVK